MGKQLFLLAAWTILVSILFSKFSIDRRRRNEHITNVNAQEFNDLKKKNQLIDVRDKESYKKEHIMGARNIPISDIKYAQNKLFKNKPIYLYCDSGKKATKAAKKLISIGYSDIIIMKDKLSNYKGNMQQK